MNYFNKKGLIHLKEKIDNEINIKLEEYSKTNEVNQMINTAIETNITNVLEGDY